MKRLCIVAVLACGCAEENEPEIINLDPQYASLELVNVGDPASWIFTVERRVPATCNDADGWELLRSVVHSSNCPGLDCTTTEPVRLEPMDLRVTYHAQTSSQHVIRETHQVLCGVTFHIPRESLTAQLFVSPPPGG